MAIRRKPPPNSSEWGNRTSSGPRLSCADAVLQKNDAGAPVVGDGHTFSVVALKVSGPHGPLAARPAVGPSFP
jgi:hypothetical protein